MWRRRRSTGTLGSSSPSSPISNTGPVIPPAEVDRLFQAFQRLDPRRIHHGAGHGLGLSIVRAIATAHGATISALALPRGGISIEVTFPPPAPRHGAADEAMPPLALAD